MAINPSNGKTKAGESWFQGQLRLSEEKKRKGKRKLFLKRVVDICFSSHNKLVYWVFLSVFPSTQDACQLRTV